MITPFTLVLLASSVFAQSSSTCTTTVTAVTVQVNNGASTTMGSSVATLSPSLSTTSTTSINASCPFTLTTSTLDGTTGILSQIEDGQVQTLSGLTTTSTFTISNGQVYDQLGRICSISGQNQSQFQCNYVPTTGSTLTTFSLINNLLAFQGNTTFYACYLGQVGSGYNIYSQLTGNQSGCKAITLTAASTCTTGAVGSTAPRVSSAAATAVANTATTKAATVNSAVTAVSGTSTVMSSSRATTVISSATTTAIYTGTASAAKASSTGLIMAFLGLVYLMI